MFFLHYSVATGSYLLINAAFYFISIIFPCNNVSVGFCLSDFFFEYLSYFKVCHACFFNTYLKKIEIGNFPCFVRICELK